MNRPDDFDFLIEHLSNFLINDALEFEMSHGGYYSFNITAQSISIDISTTNMYLSTSCVKPKEFYAVDIEHYSDIKNISKVTEARRVLDNITNKLKQEFISENMRERLLNLY